MTESIWRCPLCQAPLTPADNSLRCPSGHSFDCAREGYVNLLPAQHKKSKQPGDNKQMVASRRAFLDAGFYAPLSEAINQLCEEATAELTSCTLLDCGCGEGYYTRQLAQTQLEKYQIAGLDISKFAVRAAAKSAKAHQFAVGSSYRLPVADDQVDLILRVFAPGDEQESARVLRPHGHLLLVTPASEHLRELKQLIYPQAKEHQPPQTPDGFELVKQQQVSYTLQLPNQQRISQLLLMTPFYWQIPPKARERAAQLSELTTQADFCLSLYRVA